MNEISCSTKCPEINLNVVQKICNLGLNMKTRSKGTIDTTLKRKTSIAPLNREPGRLSRTATGTGTDLKTPNDKERKVRTPKSKRKSITPRRDDLICSQQFDSQVVVGWDCNSPDSLRDLRKSSDDDPADLISRLINDEPDDVAVPKRSTPPLLGMWRDGQKEETQNLETNTLLPNRLKKRGRVRRKSAKDSVSQALLQKLEKALDKCSETNKETEPRNAEVEVFASDCEEGQEGEKEVVAANTSADLFDSTGHSAHPELHTPGPVPVEEGQEADWSDDELFEDESFMVRPTQLSVETKKSQVFGLKRKPFQDTGLPLSKCSRVSERQAAGRLGQVAPQSSSATSTSSCRFTAISAKPSVTYSYCDARASTKVASANTKARQFQTNVATAAATATVSSSVSRGATVHTGGNKTQNPGNFYNSRKVTAAVSSVTQSKPMSVMNTSVMRSCAGYQPTSIGTSCQTVLQSSTLYGVNQSTQNRPSAFKKHSSFSGTESPSQSRTSARKRSISGNSDAQLWSGNVMTSNVVSTSTCQSRVAQSSSISSHGQAKTSFTPYHQKSAFKPHTATSSSCANNSPVMSGGAKDSVRYRDGGPRLSSGAFDTSISDDLLCQLAEPDEILDTQMEAAKPARQYTTPASVGSKTVTASVFSRNNMCSKAGAMKTVDSDASKINNHVQGTSTTGQSKQYRFRDSQKLAATTTTATKSPPVVPFAPAKVHVKAELPKPDSKGGVIGDGRMETLVEEELLDFSDDAFEDEFSDDDGLTEPQILAMLDEAEFLATQQCANSSQKSNQGSVTNSQGHTSGSQGRTSNSQGHVFGSPEKVSNSQGQGSQGAVFASPTKYTAEEIERKRMQAIEKRSPGKISNSQGQTSDSQGYVFGSPEKVSNSQGAVSASPTKYTAEEIERKRMEAIEKRSPGKVSNSQGRTSYGQGHVAGSPENVSNSQGEASQGAVSASQAKYTAQEIERKKREAIEKRRLKSQMRNSQAF